MPLYRNVVACLCLLATVNGDPQAPSKIRGATAERDLSPIEIGATTTGELKTYIVVYKKSSTSTIQAASTATSALVQSVGGAVVAEYNTVLNGAAVTLTASAAEQLKQNAAIDFIVEDKPRKLSTTSWGLDRIDQRDFPLDGNYRWERAMNAGAGVNVCVIDSGIDEDYLGGNDIKIGGGVNFGDEPVGVNPWNDCEGHGTHVAGTIGSRLYGVAPGATLWAVRVSNCDGGGSVAASISGIEWCAQKARQVGGKWVANMSYGGDPDPAENMAVANARAQGIVMVAAAGNENWDACDFGPANEPSAITVASSTVNDVRSDFSNYGTCVDIFAPGSNILSLGLKNPGQATRPIFLSGTSMAAPHAAGVAALFFQVSNNANETEAAMRAAAVPGKIIDPFGSPNVLVQVPVSLKKPKQPKARRVL